MLTLNLPFYLRPERAPQMHTGTTDFLPTSGTTGGPPLAPAGTSQAALAALPSLTWGAGWATAPNPGASGTSRELLAFWDGFPTVPPVPSDLRAPFPILAHDRSELVFTSMGAFQAAVAARQDSSGKDIACLDATGIRYADLNTDFADATNGAEIRYIFRESDGVKVGEAFLYRSSPTVTIQHWVLFNSDRFDHVRVVRHALGGSLTAFLTDLQSRKTSGVAWPHVVETCTHFLSCPW